MKINNISTFFNTKGTAHNISSHISDFIDIYYLSNLYLPCLLRKYVTSKSDVYLMQTKKTPTTPLTDQFN